VLEEPGFGRVARVEAVIRILSPDACRGAGMVGSVAFLPGGEYTSEQMREMACAVLESRPDWYLYGYVSGSTLESDSHWCANAVPQPADATTASSGRI
jgi:hypothetical protein